MMGLDRGGSCAGVLFRVTGPHASDKLAPVWRREMIGRAYRPVWVNVATTAGQQRAICFVADRTSERYAGRLGEAEIARCMARACGSVGPNATYLLETWRHCETMGIADRMLRRLQKRVAGELMRQE
jgi:cation transport protein ChaC